MWETSHLAVGLNGRKFRHLHQKHNPNQHQLEQTCMHIISNV